MTAITRSKIAPALFLALGVMLLGLQPVQAGSGSLGFSGTVPGRGDAVDVAQTIVSFGSHAGLPVGSLVGASSDAAVFQDSGQPISADALGFLETAAGPVLVVPLDERALQGFSVCSLGTAQCLRYRVARP